VPPRVIAQPRVGHTIWTWIPKALILTL
jgi:hypothetical protein